MEPFKWGPQFVTGIPDIDNQHRRLVSMVNNFSEVLTENNNDKTQILNLFKELSRYAKEHFFSEEHLMERMKVDIRHVKPHIVQHCEFVTDISNIAESLDMENPKDSRMLLEYLVHWLVFHILGTDQNMALQIAEIQIGTSPEEAFTLNEKKLSSSTKPLITALNGLFVLVSKRNKELKDLNQTLEERIAERTEELVKANEELRKISITDHLTELPNRRFAMGQLQLLFKETGTDRQPLSCMMIDADNFKEINDLYGHDAGDVVLKRLARELKYSVRSDDIVCRLGGDEFIVICPSTDLDGAVHLGELTRKKIASLNVPVGQGGKWLGSVSIGVASTTDKTRDVNTLLKEADEAVYKAKNSGRNCVKTHNLP